MPDIDPEITDRYYVRGSRMAWLEMLRKCMQELGYDSEEAKAVRWVSEREMTLGQLRDLCEDYGDNDWPDDLHLGDVIEKHLAPYLDERRKPRRRKAKP